LLVTVRGGAKQRTHRVKAGETLIGIAKTYGLAADELAKANKLSKKNAIITGQELTIPTPAKPATGTAKRDEKSRASKPEGTPKADAPSQRSHVVKKGDSLSHIARRYGVSVEALSKANGLSSKKKIFPGQRLTIPSAGEHQATPTGNAKSANDPKVSVTKAAKTQKPSTAPKSSKPAIQSTPSKPSPKPKR
jgi:LysM repeat protein